MYKTESNGKDLEITVGKIKIVIKYRKGKGSYQIGIDAPEDMEIIKKILVREK